MCSPVITLITTMASLDNVWISYVSTVNVLQLPYNNIDQKETGSFNCSLITTVITWILNTFMLGFHMFYFNEVLNAVQ